MHDLQPITALGGAQARIDAFDGLRIAESPDWAMASLAARNGRAADMAAAARGFLGMALPEVGRCAAAGAFGAFWIGPGQWMIEAPHAGREDLAAALKSAVRDSGSVTEQTDGWVRFELTGPRCPDVLERLCNADVRAMATQAATRARVEHLGCFVIRRAADRFSVIGPRSSAGSLHRALVAAAASAL